jgi:hypothetical protein
MSHLNRGWFAAHTDAFHRLVGCNDQVLGRFGIQLSIVWECTCLDCSDAAALAVVDHIAVTSTLFCLLRIAYYQSINVDSLCRGRTSDTMASSAQILWILEAANAALSGTSKWLKPDSNYIEDSLVCC